MLGAIDECHIPIKCNKIAVRFDLFNSRLFGTLTFTIACSLLILFASNSSLQSKTCDP